MGGVISCTPDRERARSLLEMADLRMETINLMKENPDRFASKIVEEYYEAVLELITAIMCMDGFKVKSDSPGSHIASIEYMRRYPEIGESEIHLINDLRKKRIGIKYYGRHVSRDYLEAKEKMITDVIEKLKKMCKKN